MSLQLLARLPRRQALALAQLDQALHVLLAHGVRINDFQMGRQDNAMGGRHRLDGGALAEQHAARDALFRADDRGPDGARLVPSGSTMRWFAARAFWISR